MLPYVGNGDSLARCKLADVVHHIFDKYRTLSYISLHGDFDIVGRAELDRRSRHDGGVSVQDGCCW